MAPAMVLAAIFSVFWGRQYDKRGFVFAVFPSLGLLMAGYLMMFFCRATALVFIGSLLVMCGFLAGSAAFGAIVRDRIPANRSGMFQGLRIVAQVLIPGVVGPMIGKWILRNADVVVNDDGTSSFIPSADIFLGAFAVALVLMVLLIVLMPYFKKDKTNETN
jgi:MFS family permease